MTGRWLETHRRVVVGGALIVWVVGTLTFLGIVLAYDLGFFGPLGGSFVLAFGAFTVTGAVIAWHRPGHAVGIIFLALGTAPAVANTLAAMAMGPFAEHSLHLRSFFVAVGVATTSATMPLLFVSILLFPDGRLPTPRWRWLPRSAAVMGVLGGVAAFSGGAWGGDAGQAILGPPFGGQLRGVAAVLSPVFFGLLPVLLVSSVVAAVLRFLRSDGVLRQQMKWLALAASALVANAAGIFVTQGSVATPPGTPAVMFSLGVALIPVSAGIAILRHRLYDVDLVINRALVFGTLAAFITALYAATVVGVGSLIGDASNLVLTLGATALVAVVFEPARARVQGWANRAVYGRRATPYEVLTAVIDDLGSGGSSGDQLEAMAALLIEGTGARHATIWVEVDGSLRAAACAPAHEVEEHDVVGLDVESDTGGLVEHPAVTHSAPVWLDGELLGALSFERGREDPVTPHERALLGQLAGQASLLLGNARLRERLRTRLAELRSSRQRLVAAQDEARRKLERDLHDGAQQQLVALKVKLALARTIATKEAATEEVTGLIEGLSADADVAVESLRDLARGIYPPLLEAEGLERALASQTQRSPIPVALRVSDLRRYERQVEATVYFCVLEALRNAVTHAQATCLEVVVHEADGRLHLRVADDGRGFDPAEVAYGLGLTNMGDRLDALGGTLEVDATGDGGVQVTGSIPLTERRAGARGAELATV